MGRMLVVPSRAESLPYVVLEAAAAGMPIIATKVGGIPEIFGPQAGHLVPPDDMPRSSQRSLRRLAIRPTQRMAQAVHAAGAQRFSVTTMVESGLAAYREAIAKRKFAQFT